MVLGGATRAILYIRLMSWACRTYGGHEFGQVKSIGTGPREVGTIALNYEMSGHNGKFGIVRSMTVSTHNCGVMPQRPLLQGFARNAQFLAANYGYEALLYAVIPSNSWFVGVY